MSEARETCKVCGEYLTDSHLIGIRNVQVCRTAKKTGCEFGWNHPTDCPGLHHGTSGTNSDTETYRYSR